MSAGDCFWLLYRLLLSVMIQPTSQPLHWQRADESFGNRQIDFFFNSWQSGRACPIVLSLVRLLYRRYFSERWKWKVWSSQYHGLFWMVRTAARQVIVMVQVDKRKIKKELEGKAIDEWEKSIKNFTSRVCASRFQSSSKIRITIRWWYSVREFAWEYVGLRQTTRITEKL